MGQREQPDLQRSADVAEPLGLDQPQAPGGVAVLIVELERVAHWHR